MVYIIIHQNPEIREQCALEVMSKNLKKNIEVLEDISCDPDFCIIKKEKKGNIKIEQIKKLQKNLLYTPFNKSQQFGIIQDAHFMTPEAQNALLKTLEECNESTTIILMVKNEDSILQTILSRCTRMYPNTQESERAILEQELFDIETFLQKPIYEQINEIENIVKEDQTQSFLENLTNFFRQKYSEKLKSGQNAQSEEIILKILSQAEYRITKNANVKITLEYICFKISHIWGTSSMHQQNHPMENFS